MFAKWRHVLTKAYRMILDFRPGLISAYAAGATLFIIISFFPFTIILLFCLRMIPFTHSYFETIELGFVPDPIRQLLFAMVREIAENSATAILPLAVGTALWSASSGFVSLTRGLNNVYHCDETRHFLTIRFACIIYTIIFTLLILLVLVFLVFGNQILEWILIEFPPLSKILSPIARFRSFGTALVLIIFFCAIYKLVPNRKTRFFKEFPGASLSAVGWLIFSQLYSLYISRMGDRPPIYGSLTAVVFMIIWLYACIYILFIGAHINVLWLKRKQSQ